MLNESIAVKRALDDLAIRFPNNEFVRVSKDHLVNTQKIFMAKFPEIIIADKMSVITVEDAYKELLESKIQS
jgi:DNA-binding LytR/AlgR family response regulator